MLRSHDITEKGYGALGSVVTGRSSMARAFLVLALVVAACGPSVTNNPDAGNPGPDGPGGACTGTDTRCAGQTFQQCQGGSWVDVQACPGVCHQDLGCVACNPDFGRTCVGDEVHDCLPD